MADTLVTALRLSRKWHRWGAWGVAIFLLLWTVTGVLMLLPSVPPGARTVDRGELRIGDDLLPPQTALAALGGDREVDDVALRAVELRTVAGRLVYQFTLGKGAIRLVDARSGRPFVLDDSIARRLAVAGLGHRADVRAVERLTTKDRRYRGPLPAVRVSFGDSRRTVAFVAMDGTVSYHDSRLRIKNVAGGLHTFTIPGVTGNDPKLRHRLLVGVSVLSLALIVTGYVLLVPPRKRSAA